MATGAALPRIGVLALIALAIPIVLYALGLQFFGIDDLEFQARFARLPLAAAAHVVGGGNALLNGFDAAYPVVAWLCWMPNLIIAEWWLLAHGLTP